MLLGSALTILRDHGFVREADAARHMNWKDERYMLDRGEVGLVCGERTAARMMAEVARDWLGARDAAGYVAGGE